MNGGKISLRDLEADGDDYGEKTERVLLPDGTVEYFLTYDDILRACQTKAGMQLAMELYREEDDYFTCNNLLQIAMFDEVVYG